MKPRLVNFLLVLVLGWAAGSGNGDAQEVSTFAVPGPKLRFLLVPVIDYNAANQPLVIKPFGMTAELMEGGILAVNLAGEPGLRSQVGGSVQDFWSDEWPGTVLAGQMHAFPSGGPFGGVTVDGFYVNRPPNIAGAATEADTLSAVSRMLNKIGYGKVPLENPAALDSSPAVDARLRNNVDFLVVMGPGFSGSVRSIDGVDVAFLGCGTGGIASYHWVGEAVHEFGHLLGISLESYHATHEGPNVWNVMSSAYGAFPGGVPAWLRHRMGFGRKEQSVRRGRSATVLLPPTLVQGSGDLPEYLRLDNGTISGSGSEEWLFAEYRRKVPGSVPAFDGAHHYFPEGEADGLLVHALDARASQWFFNGGAGLPLFSAPRGQRELAGVMAVSPWIDLKARQGNVNQNALFTTEGPLLARSAGLSGVLNRRQGSVNADGNAVWEIRPAGAVGDALGSAVNFLGRSMAQEAAALGTWTSNAVGNPPVAGTAVKPGGWYFHEGTGTGPVTGFPNALRVFSNRAPDSAYRIAGTWAHCPSRDGEVLVFGATRDGTAGAVGSLVQMVVTVTTPEGAPLRRLERTLSAPPGMLEYYHIDLSDSPGQVVNLRLEFSAAGAFGVALGEAWFFRKGDPMRADIGGGYTRLGGVPVVTGTTTTAVAGGVSGRGESVLMEDGVTYDRCLALVPENKARGVATFTANDYVVPATGGFLRGSVGYAATATGVSDGAVLRVTVDDGVRPWPLAEVGQVDQAEVGAPGATLIMPSTAELFRYNPYFQAGSGLAWSTSAQWTQGDTLAARDVSGDGIADLVIFTARAPWRVLVCRGTGTGLAAPVSWLEDWCVPGSRQVLADVNGDGRADVVRISADGTAEVALSSTNPLQPGSRFFTPSGVTLPDVARAGEIVMGGKVTGTGREDLVICTLANVPDEGPGKPSRVEGRVRVARANAGGVLAAPAGWSNFGPLGSDIPLVGDMDADGLDDLLHVNPNGNVRYNASTSSAFAGPVATLWGSVALTHPANDPPTPAGLISPGSRYTTGPIYFYGRHNGRPGIFSFARKTEGLVYVSWKRPEDNVQISSNLSVAYGFGSDWPLVADFTGDGNADLVITAPQVVGNAELYVSPRPAPDYDSLGKELETANDRPRLNRFVHDLSPYAGKTVRLRIEADAGPNDAVGDVLFFPELKYYGAESTAPAEAAPTLAIVRNSAASVRLTWPIESCYQTLEYSGDLTHWSRELNARVAVGSFWAVDFTQVPEFPKLFWRLRQ